MGLKDLDTVSCDVLVIGGGGSGLRAAIEAKERGVDVVVVSKSRVGYGNNTYISKGTFAAAAGWGDSRDNPDVHLRDSIIGGRFINNQRLLKAMTREAEAQIGFLEKCGVRFLRHDGKIAIKHTPGHSYPRHVRGEHQAGRDLVIPLREYAKKIGVRFAERITITRLLTSNERVAAAIGVSRDGRFLAFVAKCMILASGGFAQIYLHTNNAAGACGHGHALAFELGIRLKDMEFIQFYPTALGPRGGRILLYEALVFNAGAVLKNAQGDDIISKHGLSDPMAMTRDRLTRAIMVEILEGRDVAGGVVMDLSEASPEKLTRLRHLLPQASPSNEGRYIVSPTAHFCMGGIDINENGETAVPGLFAAGEVCAGVHGANRLGGNALTEVFAMGGIAGRNAALRAKETDLPALHKTEIPEASVPYQSLRFPGESDLQRMRQDLKEVMWYNAGIIREKKELEKALGKIRKISSYGINTHVTDTGGLLTSLELHSMLLVSEMVCRAALLRNESRGAHYRSDYPEEDNDNWLKNIMICKEDKKIRLTAVPVPAEPLALST
jgi:succinate dehydrogenase/fumarate reductase flavoprotein subunit